MGSFNRVGSWSTCALHVATFAGIAIAQPLFDSLGRAPEFLVAHDLGPREILAVAAILSIGIPALLGAIAALVTGVHSRAGHIVTLVLIAVLVALVALHAIRNLDVPPVAPVIVALTTGAALATAYHRFTAVRSFSTWLAPGIVIFPLVFLFRPGVQGLLWPNEQKLPESSNVTTPVVLVVFDGLPLTSLLDENRVIDRELYPSFAALADESTWYRNATTVSDFTRWAVPSILSGRYPRAAALPVASDHPDTIFSLLGASHAVRVLEPISRLCPQTVCDYGRESIAEEMIAFADTLAVAYLHAIAPSRLEETLPPINHGWAEGIPPSEKPGEVWLKGGEQSRRGQAVAFVDSIESDDSQPSFHFLHMLLPHTPLAYLPGGQRYGTERSLPGLLEGGRDRWLDDEWAVTQGYRRFLLQVGYVDTLLGHIIHRLKEVGIYDRALVVVTSDHGASFHRGQPFRRVTDTTYMDVLPVPLFVKAPGQRQGQSSDRNVESVDILPTMADMLKVKVPWTVDGVSAAGDRPARASKTVFYSEARRVRNFGPSLLDAAFASVDRKLDLFGTDGNYFRIPTTSPHRELIGRNVDELSVTDATDNIEFALDVHGDFANVRPESRFVPAHLAGRARWRDKNDPAVIAVAVNGTVRATTRTYTFRGRGAPGSWSVVLPPDSFHTGENDIDVFVVRPADTPVLHRAHFSHAPPVNLLSDTAAYGLRVTHEGLHDREGDGQGSFRWTNGNARIVVPLEGRPAPRSVRLNLATAGPQEKDLTVRVNGCAIFEGKVPTGRWSRIFAIQDCGEDDETVIELLSNTHQPSSKRELGVAVERLDLLDQPWPPAATPLPESDRRSHIRLRNLSGDGATVKSTQTIAVTVANRGTALWASRGDVNREHAIVRFGVLWFRRGDTRQPAAVQRVELPRTLVPGDSVDLSFQLVPVGQGNEPLPAGEYEAWLGVLQEGVSWFYSSGDSVRKLRVAHSP